MTTSTSSIPAARAPRTRRLAALAAGALTALSLTPSVAAAAPTASRATPALDVARSAMPVSAAAVGKLGPSGCTHDGTTDSCDLWAQPSTLSVLGTPIPVWGFSSSSAAGSATVPGPLLAVPVGDTVTITVHNQLQQNVSLALPGQPADSFVEGLSVDRQTVGAVPGGTASYTFHATRAGTFLYEAGHTPDGARQVAMGLAGALVVLPTDPPAAGREYDDEAVVVLNDVDPALNEAPLSFDMRKFRPRYRLLNGRPFPSTSPISTDQGHRVLLRYVNAGSVTHPMSLLGADQLLVARDGHPTVHAESEVVEAVESGATADTIVTMPSGPERRVTLFEAGQHLDNDGQTDADPGHVALGGMMTFLDTDAPPPTDDLVGPVPAHVTASPNPSNGLGDVTVTADLSDRRTGGSNVTAAEIVVDDAVDTAVGSGIPMGPADRFGGVDVDGVTATIPAEPAGGASCTPDTGPVPVALSCLSAGKHVVYVRGLDSASNWGVVGSVVLQLPKTGPSTRAGAVSPSPANGTAKLVVTATGDDGDAGGSIDGAEMFLDTVGTAGQGIAMTLNRSATVVAETGTLPAGPPSGETCTTYPAAASCLSEGVHHLFVHSHDSLGLWGPVLDVPVTVDRTGPAVNPLEVAPNPTNGIVSSLSDPGNLVVSGIATDRDAGAALQSPVVDVEGFIDTVGATGTGFSLIATDGTLDTSSESFYGLIPLSQVTGLGNGVHHVYVRAQDAAGNWGAVSAADLVVDRQAPTLTSLSASPNPTNGATSLVLTAPVTGDTAFGAAEYWIGTTDPGVGKATRATVTYVSGSVVVTVPLAGIPAGTTAFNLRVQDQAGNWSKPVATTVTVTKPNAIFSDTFDSGTLAAWSRVTGPGSAISVTTAAGLPQGTGNRGLQLTLPGGRGNTAAYLTDNTPAAETGYHVRFSLDPRTLGNGSAQALTLLDARSGNASVFRLEMRRNGPTAQLRTVMSRSGGQPVTGAWQNLTAGARTIQLDWVSGGATGPTAGSLRLVVDGQTVSTSVGNTSTLRVESALLGLVGGFNNTSAGSAYVDTFLSVRNTLP